MKVFYASTKESVSGAVNAVLDALDWKSILPAGEDILIKVNLTWDFVRPGVNTGTWTVEAIVKRISNHVGRIYIGESSQILVDATRAFRVSGMNHVAERNNLTWHNFSEHAWSQKRVGDIEFGIPEICTRMPVISVPVVKTHYRSVISVALKHLYGCLDDNRHNYHYRLADYVAAVNSVIPVLFTVADGSVSLEGNGPKPGIPKQTDFVAGSTNRAALDYSIARVMGIDPRSVENTMKAGGTAEDLEDIPLPPLNAVPCFSFIQARPNFIARVEGRLRGSREHNTPSSDGPLMGLMKLGAKRWYRLAYYLLGQKRDAAEWIRTNRYGPQWEGLPEGDST